MARHRPRILFLFFVLVATVLAGVSLRAQGRRPAPPPPPPSAPPVYPGSTGRRDASPPPAEMRLRGRLSAPQDLGLLEGPDRAQWQKPDQIMDTLLIAEGSVVADLGAGLGWFTARLSARVGPNGVVYAEDIQPAMIEAIQRRIQRENLRNVRPILGTPNDPRLTPEIDAALIVDTFREMQIAPADPVMLLKRVAEALKPDGRIGVVDFNPGAGGPGPAADQRVPPESIVTAAVAAGLRVISRDPQINQFQYLLVFGKAASTHGGQ